VSRCQPPREEGLQNFRVRVNPLGNSPEPVPDQGWDRCCSLSLGSFSELAGTLAIGVSSPMR